MSTYDIEILHEDDDLLVINKPAGILVHPDTAETSERTVADWVRDTYPAARSVGEPLRLRDGTEIDRPGIVHRLDRDTSGVLVLVKTHAAFSALKRQFQNGEIEKTYNAFVYGVPEPRHGTIDRPIGRSSKDFRLRSAQRGARGTLRAAVTEYTVTEENGEYAYLTIWPRTGRTHQIRVHCKAIHHPIVCDALYAPKQPCTLGFERTALHAAAIRFQLPGGDEQTCTAPLPADFTAARAALGSV